MASFDSSSDFSSVNTRPLWTDTTSLPKFTKMSGHVAVDVCIVGAGITGLTAADILKRAGLSVAVIDLGRVGSGETGHTSAHLTEVFDLGYRGLISHFGLEGARLAAQSLRRGIEQIEVNSARFACDFKRVPGFKFTEKREQGASIQAEVLAALASGVSASLTDESPFPFKIEQAMRIDQQAQFNPLAYVQGLARTIPGDGSYVFEETRMIDVIEGEPCKVLTDCGTLLADKVFVAANVPSSNRFVMHTKIAAYRTYAIAAPASQAYNKNCLGWDLDDPYHYLRSFDFNGVNHLIVGGEDHKTGQDVNSERHFERLEEWARERFDLGRLSHRWSGQVIESVDGLPYIGRNPLSENIYVATGFSGTGLAMGSMAAMLVSDLIQGIKNPWAELYDARRVKPLASLRSFIAENIDYPSHIIGDRFAPAQAKGTDQLREDEGAIVRMDGKKIAAYRDTTGELHLLSPVCPHMGCHVQWNGAEKSWDCPCHGARFAPTGKLLNGPAVADLASENVDSNAPMTPIRVESDLRDSPGLGAPILSMFSCPYTPKR